MIDEHTRWHSPGFAEIFWRGVVRGVVGGVVLGVAYGGSALYVLALLGALSGEPGDATVLLFLPFAAGIGFLGGLLAGLVAGVVLAATLAAWLGSAGVRGMQVHRVAANARVIAGLLTAVLVSIVALNDHTGDVWDLVLVDLIPALIAITYGAWTGGRIVTAAATRDQLEPATRLPG